MFGLMRVETHVEAVEERDLLIRELQKVNDGLRERNADLLGEVSALRQLLNRAVEELEESRKAHAGSVKVVGRLLRQIGGF